MELRDKKILVTGGNGFLGSAVVRTLKAHGATPENISSPRSSECDFRVWENCVRATKDIDIVIHLAAVVGGIGANSAHPGKFFYENMIMGIQLMEAARQNDVKKFVAIGTVCAYPKHTPIPFKEDDLWSGYPEDTNAPYGLAKKMLLVQAQSYRKEYDFNAIYLLPVNLYGPGDNFDLQSSHVIPALIRKVGEAKKNNAAYLEVWGTGTPTREFLYVDDAAEGIVRATEHYEKSDPVNLGSGMEISIKDLIELICHLMDYKGEVRFDTSKPDGQPRRSLDVSRAKKEFDFTAGTSFEEGLRRTISWWQEKESGL